jgi:transcriptional regulator with XRE-family HTH domain
MDKTLGQRIRELRTKLKLSLRELADHIDITPPFLSDIELGRRNPSEETLRALAKALKTNYDDLRTYDQRPLVEQIKARTSTDPRYGRIMRRVAALSTDKLEELLKKHT